LEESIQMKLLRRHFHLVVIAFVLAMAQTLAAQTFRGGIAGTVEDSTGAAVAHAKISLTGTDTGFHREMESTSAGAYSFEDLPLGLYSVEVAGTGFQPKKVDKISVRPGQVYSLEIQLGVAASTELVEVDAAAVSLDTVSSTNNSVVNEKAVTNIPLNGRDFTQLVKIVPGYNGAGSLNGTRTNQNNWQIDGADNNDVWHNTSAANQGGVGTIAGVTIPIDAIDQFTVQSQSNAEAGRNGGGVISLAIKTGTNNLHGSAYYFNRNEFFAARSPFLTTSQRKATLRNQQFGGSLGGPILQDKLFFFLNYERQTFTIGSVASTEPTAAYVQAATALLQKHNIPVNPLSLNVLSIWPQGNKPAGPAANGNYFDPRPQKGYSDNAIGNVTYNLTQRQNLRLQGFVGTGRQYETIGTNVYEYYEVAPDITQNFSAIHNWAITDRVSNQLLVAVGIFNQTFNDANHSYNMPALGLNTGVTNPSLLGAPTITIVGSSTFDQTGPTQPIGRKDYTGHITDVANWVSGKHQFRFGGEFRRNYMDLQYQRNVRGTFTFNGQATANSGIRALLPTGATPYFCNTGETTCANDGGADIRGLADYLAGYVSSSSFTQGYLRRSIYQKTFAIFAQDQYQVSRNLTLNYGLRYEYNAPFTSDGVLSVYRPGAPGADGYGLVLSGGAGKPSVYPGNFTNLAPRFGFSYQVAPKMVLRATYGIYFDAPNFNGFFDNRPGNGGAVGVQGNNTGTTPVRNVSPSFYQWKTGVNPFDITPGPTTVFGLASISPNFRTAYTQNFNLNTEYQLSRNTIATVAYVGALGRRLFNLSDINQARPGATNSTAAEVARRPIYLSKAVPNYATIGALNEAQSEGTSNYNSLQASVRTSGFHGVTAQASYTLGHALDVISSTRGLAPQDSLNLAGDYGHADFDVRHTFNGYIVYEVPRIGHFLPLLTKGWQGNAFVTAFTGTPFSAKVGSDISGTGENQDRVNLAPGVALRTSTGTSLITPTSGAPYAQIYSPSAFVAPGAGSFGTTARNAFRGPGFSTVDASLVKNTQIREKISLQLRAEMFNIFNRINLANPTGSISSSSFGRSTSTRNSSGAPGIGPGEPFNVQFAGKIIF
jgi:hypothetical protein